MMKRLSRNQAAREEKEHWLYDHARFLLQNPDLAIFLLSIVLLPTQLGKHFWIGSSLVSGVRIDYLSPTLYVTDILIFLLVVFIVLKNKFRHVMYPIRQHKFFSIAFFCWILLTVALSNNIFIGFYGFLKLIEFIFFGLYTKYVFEKQSTSILIAFSIGLLYESILAALQYVNQSSIGGLLYFLGERTFTSQTPGIANASILGELILRPYGTLPHPNVLAGYCLIGFVFVLIFVLKRKFSGGLQIFFLSTLLASSSALFLTLGRISIALWFFSLLWIVITKKKKKIFQIRNILIAFFVFGLILFLFSETLHGRFAEGITGESFEQRKQLVISAIAMWKDFSFFGVGLNNFLIRLPHYYLNTSTVFYLQPVHSIFLLTLAETGIIGFAFLLYFFWITFRNCNPTFKIIFFLVIIIGNFDHYLFTLQQGQLLTAFILGFLSSQQQSSRFRSRAIEN